MKNGNIYSGIAEQNGLVQASVKNKEAVISALAEAARKADH